MMRRFFLPLLLAIAASAHAATGPVAAATTAAPAGAAQKTSQALTESPIAVENAGFEAAMVNGVLPGWRTSQHIGTIAYSMTTDNSTATQGSRSFRMERLQEQIYGLVDQTIQISPDLAGKTLRYSAMLKTEDVGSEGWLLVVTFHAGTGAIIDQVRSTPLTGTRGWQRVSLEASIPEGTRSLVIGVLLLDAGTGWIDDITLGTLVAAPARTLAVEYHHAEFGHYFLTAFPDEIAALDSGAHAGWTRTGQSFAVQTAPADGLSEVCRFFSTRFSPKSSHFYTPDPAECATVKGNADWTFEAVAFHALRPTTAGVCPDDRVRLHRLYNQGIGGAPNHRYTTSSSIRVEMIARGWISEGHGSEGVVACLPN